MCSKQNKSYTKLILAATSYFIIVFSAAFVFGVIRTIVLTKGIMQSELIAVLVEVPIVLRISWEASKWIVNHHQVSSNYIDRLVMGLLAFGLLMTAELFFAMKLFNSTPLEFVRELISSMAKSVGFIGQILFGFLPLIQSFEKGFKTTKYKPRTRT